MCISWLGSVNGERSGYPWRASLEILGRLPVVRQRSFASARGRHAFAFVQTAGTADPGQDPRDAPDIAAPWSMLDPTPEGRPPDWYPKLRYGGG